MRKSKWSRWSLTTDQEKPLDLEHHWRQALDAYKHQMSHLTWGSTGLKIIDIAY